MRKRVYWTGRAFRAGFRKLANVIATQVYRATLAQLGAGSVVHAGVRFDRPATVSVGADCLIWRGVGVAAESGEAMLLIGDRVHVNRDVLLDTTGGLTLGDDVLISEGAILYTHDHGLDPLSDPALHPKNVGRGAWIGARAIVLPGCSTIGASAVIGAGAVVTKDVPADAIVAGNPARVIGQRAAGLVAA